MTTDGSVAVHLTVPSGTPATGTASPPPAPPVRNDSPLPRTGVELIGLLLLAAALLALGALLVRASHSRRTA